MKKNQKITEALTSQQAAVLKVISKHIKAYGVPPTRADISRKMGFKSSNAAEDHLRTLERKGRIILSRGKARGIQLVTSKEVFGLPVLRLKNQKISSVAENNIEERYKIDPECFKHTVTFLLKVESPFVRAGLFEGDLLAIHEGSSAKHGQLVLVSANKEIFLAIYHSNKEGVALIFSESSVPLQVVKGINFQIEGVVVALIREDLRFE